MSEIWCPLFSVAQRINSEGHWRTAGAKNDVLEKQDWQRDRLLHYLNVFYKRTIIKNIKKNKKWKEGKRVKKGHYLI